jgi:hypothetical protein
MLGDAILKVMLILHCTREAGYFTVAMLTGAGPEAWCLLIHMEASLYLSIYLALAARLEWSRGENG